MKASWKRVFSCYKVYAEDGIGFLRVYAFLVVLDVCLVMKGHPSKVNTDLNTSHRNWFPLF